MKELSIDEKAKRYDEAIKVAKRNYETIVQMDNNCTFAKEGIVNTFHHIFPELKKSEGERMRKALISILKSDFEKDTTIYDISVGDIIAWLEKQGEQKSIDDLTPQEAMDIAVAKCFNEQKPTDKVEPKFKVGDWLVNIECGNVVMVLEVLEDNYRLDYSGDTIGTLCTELVDNDYRLWDITKDAKVGDIIYSRHNTESFEWIGIFKSLDKENKRVFFYGFWNNIAKSFSVCGNEAYVLYDDFSPATKEQRDLLFQKMKEAGYEWDAEKKELKKIKQKPTWSEEDEHKFKVVINALVEDYEATEELLNWFKSLKDRVQPKQELSEEDEEMIQALNACINVVIKSGMNYISFDSKSILIGKVKNYLKSLKNRYTWKPSDEQIEALESATENCAYSEYQDCLKELIVELKKLKE